MAYTSPTAINGTAGISSVISYISEVTHFWFGRMLMVAIFVMFLAGFIRSKPQADFVGGFAVSSYACLVIGIPFWLLGLLDSFSMGTIVAITILSSIILFVDKS